MKNLSIILLSLFWATTAVAQQNVHFESHPSPTDMTYLMNTERLNGIPMDIMRYNDLSLLSAYGSGGDLFQNFVRFIFPISGREKRVMFLPTPYWDPKKPRYHIIKWKRFESDHFDFYAYPESQQTLQSVIKYYEEEYSRNNRTFGVDSKFTKKIPIIFYQTRRDFEQTAIVDGPIPEGLGGLTEIFGWRRVTFPFEGEWSKFEHVAKHEATHVFQIAKKAKRLPLWFVEGSAETNSVYWDSDAEMITRDAFLNGFFLHIQDLWQIEGTWLMYKIGNFICNVIWDEYGEEGYRKILDNASKKSFDKNLEESLGITLEELDRKVQGIVLQRYSYLLHREDIIKESKPISSERLILASHGKYFISGGLKGSRNGLFINYLGPDGEVTTKELVEDKVYDNESLENFQKGASLTNNMVVYSMKNSANDELRVIPYLFNEKKKEFTFAEERKYIWPNVDRIQNPVLIDEHKVVFIGYVEGFSNIYIGDLNDMRLEKLTTGQAHYADLDYSAATNQIVYSLEGQRDEKRIFYNRDLMMMDLKTKEIKNLSLTKKILESEPRFSPDGKKILYVATPDMTYDLMILDLETNQNQRITTMNIGAKSPQWSTEGSILYNGFKQGAPNIFQFTIPSSKKLIQKNKPNNSKDKFTLENGNIVLPTVTKMEAKQDELVLNGFYTVQQKPVIRANDRNYTVKTIATLDKKMILKSNEGLPGDKQFKHEYLPHYFEMQGNQIQSLKSSMVAEDGISDEVRKWAALKLNGRDIVQSWMSNDHQQALLIVNNRLAKDYESFSKKHQVSLFVYHAKENSIVELEKAPVKDLDQTVQWVAFLKNDKIFMAMGSERTGPFEVYIYDQGKKNYKLLSEEVVQFRLSNDFSKAIWKNVDYSLVDFSGEKEFDSIDLNDLPDNVISAEFDEHDQPVFFSYDTAKKKWVYTTYSIQDKKYDTKEIIRKDEESVTKAAISGKGNVAVIVAPKDKKHQEQIWIWDPSKTTPLRLDTNEDDFQAMIFRKEYLTFAGTYYDSRPTKEYVWSSEFNEKVIAFDSVQTMMKQDDQLIYEGQSALYRYDQKQNASDVIESNTMGYVIRNDDLIYSSKKGEHFQVSEFDLKTKAKKQLTNTEYDKFNPTVKDKDIVYVVQKENQWSVETQNMETGKVQSIYSPTYDFTDIKNQDGQLQVDAQTKKKDYPLGPEHPSQPDYPTMLQARPVHQSLKLQNLSAAIAYDGDDIRYFVSGYADNLFSDKGVFVNSIFLGDTKYATIGFSDLNTGNNGAFFFNQRDGIQNMGVDLSKNFIFDRYRMLSPYVDFEYQSYDADSSALNSFIDPSFNNKSFYLLKFGAVYSYDVTVWDRHGPASGARLYFRTETGVDTVNARRSNTDANIDVRVYNRILPRFGFAHRLAGGTSQGPIPNIYLLGGNMSFRGVGFDDLVGQNYWVFSEDIRLPLFDFIGAKFFDPVDSIFGFFTRYFDVRTGIYTDVGATWMNQDDPDLKYSIGYFVNIPTVFGLIVRLNQGFVGEKNFGVWFGTNW